MVLNKTYQVLRDVDLHGLIRKTKHGDDLPHAVGTVVEEKEGVTVFGT